MDLNVAVCYSNEESRPETSPSVIVIGGGMAGVAAARTLHDASFQVFITESKKTSPFLCFENFRLHLKYKFVLWADSLLDTVTCRLYGSQHMPYMLLP